jgi:hypothetical protein
MYKFCFYVPQTDLEKVKNAVFDTGAGTIGNYDRCCFQIKGEGQFRPLKGSNPAIGTHYRPETVTEYKVELVVRDNLIKNAVKAMKDAHPYEEPAYSVYKMVEI